MQTPRKPTAQGEVSDGDTVMPDAQMLAGEVLTLRRDLWLFRAVYLPVLLRSACSGAVQRWQDVVRHLSATLPREGENRSARLDEGPVLRLLQTGTPDGGFRLWPPPADCFTLVGDRLCWHIYPHSGQGAAERQEQVRSVLRWAGAGDERDAAPWLELQRVLPVVEEYFLSLPPASTKRMGGYVAVLPILAELDPAFAAQALDRRQLIAAVEGDTALTAAERVRQRLALSSRTYAGCLGHGLALVMEALANNRFEEIAGLLALPEVHADAFWAGLLPKVLLAALYRKVVVLRDLAQKVPLGGAD
jgi:hypothetical protein